MITDLKQYDQERFQRLESQLSVISSKSIRSYRRSSSDQNLPSERRRLSKQTSSIVDGYTKQKSILTISELDEEFIGDQRKNSGRLIIEIEKSEVGSVKWNVYVAYLRANGFFLTFLVFLCYAAGNAFQVGANVWLADWSNDAEKYGNVTPPNTGERLGGYAGLGFGQGREMTRSRINQNFLSSKTKDLSKMNFYHFFKV